jgi:hypothetical protein
MTMKIFLPCAAMPDGMPLIITDYNLSGPKEDISRHVKRCVKCGRELELLEFIVVQGFRIIKGKKYATLEERDGVCRDCYQSKEAFWPYRGLRGQLLMRLWTIRTSGGAPMRFFNDSPEGISWRATKLRGLRWIAGAIRAQPRSDRSRSLDGIIYGKKGEVLYGDEED